MWKKDEAPEPVTYSRPEPPAPEPARAAPPPAAAPRAQGERATIGRSITIRGDVTGDEDLLIQGRINGSVDLKQHSITIGREGEVKADVIGRVIAVEGKVEGNLRAEEQVILRSSAQVQGDIVAPRVVLEDGARFRGGVDMGEAVQASAGRGNASKPSRTSYEPARTETTATTETATAGKGDGAGATAGASKTAEVAP